MAQDNSSGRVPPYSPYKPFKDVLVQMAGSVVPRRLDNYFWGSEKSGATQASLNSAFRFFGFIDDDKNATKKLDEFIERFKANEKQALADLVADSYRDAAAKIADLDSATLGQLREAFKDAYAVDKDMLKKAVRFFVYAITDAGRTLSPYIVPKTRGTARAASRPRSRVHRQRVTPQPSPAPPEGDGAKPAPTVGQMLLAKMPDFDPEWAEETQQKWFDAMREIKHLLANDAK